MSVPSPLTNISFSVIRGGYDQSQVETLLFDLEPQITELQNLLVEATQRAHTADRQLNELAVASPAVKALVDELDGLPPEPSVRVPAVDVTGLRDARKGYTPGEVQYFFDQLSLKLSELQDLVRGALRRADIAEAHLRGVRAATDAAATILADAKAEAASIIENAKAVAQAVGADRSVEDRVVDPDHDTAEV